MTIQNNRSILLVMEDFLVKNKSAYEPGLVLTLDGAHSLKVEEYLLSKNFKTFADLQDLAEEFRLGGNYYISSKKISNPPVAFDFIIGFSSRQIKVNNKFISPKYESLNFVLVLSRDFLQNEINKGRDWLSVGGLTVQAD